MLLVIQNNTFDYFLNISIEAHYYKDLFILKVFQIVRQ